MSALDLVDVQVPWPTAVVIVAMLIAPQVGGWITAARAAAVSRRSATATEKVARTLTTSNSGSHVKDQLDRIERSTHANAAAIIAVERRLDAHDQVLDEISTDTSTIITNTSE